MEDKKNYIFIGEAGSGKSEVAINFAIMLAKRKKYRVHFFDMDQTKPLFRARDAKDKIEDYGIVFHCQEQFMDAPVLVGGVTLLLKSEEDYVVIDVGGDYIGARAIGGYAPYINNHKAEVFYVHNIFRPWSNRIEHIDETLSSILQISHINLKKIKVISNPNNGYKTTVMDVLEGNKKTVEILGKYLDITYLCVNRTLFKEVKSNTEISVFPIDLFMTYEWNES